MFICRHCAVVDCDSSRSGSAGLKGDSIEVSAMGYTTKRVRVGQTKKIDLCPTGVLLNEVVARPKKEKYSKKNNPAVAFMEKIRARRDLNDPRRHDNYNYRKYERITFALNNFNIGDSASG